MRRRIACAAAAIAMLVSGGAPARAQRAAQPERPTVATHAGTVAPGYFEIEAGVERDRIDRTTSGLAPMVLKFGAGPTTQLSIFGAVVHPPRTGTALGDVGVGLKWRIVDDAPLLGDFAIFPSVKLPSGSVARGTGTGTTDVGLLLISSHQLGGVAMDLNVGYTRRSGRGRDAPTGSSLWTASFGGPASGSFGWVAELYGYPATSGSAGQPSIIALLAGPTYTARPWLVFDAGFIAPISGPQPNALYAGAVYNVGRMW